MNKPHKHAELIKAWADGAEIEEAHLKKGWKPFTDGHWMECDSWDYRIKPKSDHVYYGVFDMDGSMSIESCFTKNNDKGDHIKVTFDGETGKLKSAEVL
jgi:hypothetical protein